MDTKRPNHRPNKPLTTSEDLQDSFYTINEVAKLLKVHHTTIRRAIKNKRLKAYTLHRKWIIKKEDIQNLGDTLNDNNNNQ
jgi:DNA binding domain, excisionase family